VKPNELWMHRHAGVAVYLFVRSEHNADYCLFC